MDIAPTSKPVLEPITWHPHIILAALLYDDQRRRLMLLRFCLLACAIFAGLALIVHTYSVLPFEIAVSHALQAHAGIATSVMYGVSLIGDQPWVILILGLGAGLVATKLGWHVAAYLLAATAGEVGINVVLKWLIARPRPLDTMVRVFAPENDYSFPSGHVMFYTFFFGMLLFLIRSRIKSTAFRRIYTTILVLCIGLIGPSRIVLGAHWLMDVIAAYIMGIILLLCAIEGYLTFNQSVFASQTAHTCSGAGDEHIKS